MQERCPGCARDVSESDESCPHCGRSFAPAPGRPAPRQGRAPAPRDPEEGLPPHLRGEPAAEEEDLDISPERSRLKSAIFLFLGASALFGAYFGRKHLKGPSLVRLNPPVQASTAPLAAIIPDQPVLPGPSASPAEPEAEPPPKPKPEPPPIKLSPVNCRTEGRVKGMGKGEWCIGGEVFALSTLEPVRGAQMLFQDSAGRRFSVQTDAKGRFGAALPSNMEGYSLEVRHPDFESRYIEDWLPSIRSFSEDKRQSTLTDLSSTPHQPESVFGTEGQRVLKDYVLVTPAKSPAKGSGKPPRGRRK